jgi:nicotinamidase-related amidase
VDADGKNAPPFTAITLADIDAGKWFAVIDPVHSREYVEKLETNGKKTLVVWPYHCLQGTRGQALENQFSNMVKFYEVARKSHVVNLIKGNDPLSEMYGIIKPEYDRKNFINIDLLNKLESFDKIIICGEAKSHCVLESIKQILEYYSGRPEITKKVYILEDCMSVIPSFEDSTRDAYAEFTTKYKVNIIKSTEMKF